ncbi:DUF2807 domain-containing protein [Marixanthomonas sp. SCSIO 43207]|uniref:head GIN domain-containing protein n=1 Tax=Marixanthomonas sp. SCSIO 43207 TaxID=2779360 RepID=UPI001CA958E9|nr:head GIN domain-containing protein [Marixanthomonas sp. SCSIO 43207]UAB80285.1 DUF2807 domain-containing protein [Marixanthomonas sp. SCSIO 43207]
MKPIQILFLVLAASLTTACQFDINLGQVNGNGNVVTEERPVSESFTAIRGSAGLDVFLEQGDEAKIVVEADENLLDIIETEIVEGKLKIGTKENIGRSKAKKVYVTYTSLNTIEASSGADVIANSVVKSENLTLDCSSGSDLEVDVFAKYVIAETSSGADLKVSGKATNLDASASSGSDLNAKDLLVINCTADVSSGADITVNVKEKLISETSSGGDVHYYGNPGNVSKNESKSGGGTHKM